jgi:hypothetical protein
LRAVSERQDLGGVVLKCRLYHGGDPTERAKVEPWMDRDDAYMLDDGPHPGPCPEHQPGKPAKAPRFPANEDGA